MVKNIKNLPLTAGVYTFWDKASTAIYIGKAINLKRRIASYFDNDLEQKTKKMVESADHLTFIKVQSELESLLLEAKLINLYKPKYNILLKDDKHPLYIVITKEDFPRVITCRKPYAVSHKLAFGPFPNSSIVKYVLKEIRRIFPYSDHKIGKRPCLYSHMGLCNPCPNTIVHSTEYLVLRKKYINNIKNLKRLLSGEFKQVKNNLEKEMSKLSKLQKYEEAKEVRDKIEKLDYITTKRLRSEDYLSNPNLVDEIRDRELRELKKIISSHISNSGLKSLSRVECFDIAHLSGTNATASMVVAINGEMDHHEYKHFRIRQTKGQSDYDSMREIAQRRQKHLKDWGMPNLIIVDGGLGQVKIFHEVFKNEKVAVVGIAKHPDRLVFPDGTKLVLRDETLRLVSRIRDEAHRFARRLHHKNLTKALLRSNISDS